MSDTVIKLLAAMFPIASPQRELIVIPPPQPTLTELAAEINADYAELQRAALTAVEKAISIGKNLNAAKAQLKHGELEAYVISHFPFTVRWGQKCRTLANHETEVRQELERLRTISSHLSLEAAFKHIRSLDHRPKLKRKKPRRTN
jgi:hypothetical protein